MLSSWAWVKNRHKNISSLANPLYAKESSFDDEGL